MEVRQIAEELHGRFSEDVSVDEIEESLDSLINEYQVPEDEARRSVISRYSDGDADANANAEAGSPDEVTKVSEIDSPEEWITVEVEVVDLWEPTSDAIGQVGLVGDETDTVKFTAWAKSDLPELDEGETYRLENVVTDEYEGRMSIKLNSSTEIEEIDDEIEVGTAETEIEGALVDIQSGSGLIKRCPVEGCTRVLQNGRCAEHGDVDGEFDLRVKGVIDDGKEVHDVIFDREMTEDLTGITMEEAKQKAMDKLDTSVVTDDIHEKLVGRYFSVSGTEIGRYLLANDAEKLSADTDTDALLIRARSVGGGSDE